MTLHAYLLVSLALFSLGLIGALSHRNLIALLIGRGGNSLVNMLFNRYVVTDPTVGQIFVLIIIGLAAAEVAIFLSIILRLYRAYHDIDSEKLVELKG